MCGALSLLSACHRGGARTDDKTRVIPRDAARFSISAADDSTVTFRPVEARWIRVGMRGHAVDPLQRDALIARLTIVRADTTAIVAQITGQVSRVTASHVVLLVRPSKPWWKDRRFWVGTGAGTMLGVAIGH